MSQTPELSPEIPYSVRMNQYGRELFKFCGRDFKKLLGPGVYIAKTKRGQYLYVGSSKNIFGRTSTESHESLRLALEAEDCEVWIILAKSVAHARQMEAYLIAEQEPKYNKAGKQKGTTACRAIEEYWSFDGQ